MRHLNKIIFLFNCLSSINANLISRAQLPILDGVGVIIKMLNFKVINKFLNNLICKISELFTYLPDYNYLHYLYQ